MEVEGVRRVTGEARQRMVCHGIADWVDTQTTRCKAWRARVDDHHPGRWAQRALSWQPPGDGAGGRPRARWIDQRSRRQSQSGRSSREVRTRFEIEGVLRGDVKGAATAAVF